MKVICTSPSFAKYDDAPISALKEADLELVMLPADASIEMLAQHLPDAIAMIVAFTDINESLLAKAPRLKIVCKHGVGVDNIDLNATRQRKIFVTNVPDANKHAVADFAFGLILNTANTIAPETARQLARHENIVGIKDSAGSYDSLKGFLDAVRDIDGFDVLNGPDSLIHQGFVDGCSACISGLANVAPAEINAIWSRFHAGDIAGSRQAQEQVTGLRTDLYKVAFSPAAVKKALQLMGHEVGDSRYAVQFSDHQLQQIKNIINTYLH
ncbi:dihydrodipicolinate synthase [Klebsiella pneumoniae]|nr:dihydrodipicolinate synthase [Klebsiella pneumoniae]